MESDPEPLLRASGAPAPTDRPRLAHDRGHPHLRLLPQRRLNVVDVAIFYGARSGGIRTYLDEKSRHAALSGAFEHHVIVPGPHDHHRGGRHELPSLGVIGSNGYRVPLGVRGLRETLFEIGPDVVLLHDPFWASPTLIEQVRSLGARVVAVHHASSELTSAGLPGPSSLYVPLMRAWLRRAYRSTDAVMSVIDPRRDCEPAAVLPLRFGVHAAFRPRPHVPRGEHVLYVGRLLRQKGVFTLLDAVAEAPARYPLHLTGSGPHADALAARAERLGIEDRVRFRGFISDREQLANAYARAACVVLPGPHETFGLVALEAAASGARVVTCESTPAAHAIGSAVVTCRAGDADDLRAAIERARTLPRDLRLAAELARRFGWAQAFEHELAELERLLR